MATTTAAAKPTAVHSTVVRSVGEFDLLHPRDRQASYWFKFSDGSKPRSVLISLDDDPAEGEDDPYEAACALEEAFKTKYLIATTLNEARRIKAKLDELYEQDDHNRMEYEYKMPAWQLEEAQQKYERAKAAWDSCEPQPGEGDGDE